MTSRYQSATESKRMTGVQRDRGGPKVANFSFVVLWLRVRAPSFSLFPFRVANSSSVNMCHSVNTHRIRIDSSFFPASHHFQDSVASQLSSLSAIQSYISVLHSMPLSNTIGSLLLLPTSMYHYHIYHLPAKRTAFTRRRA